MPPARSSGCLQRTRMRENCASYKLGKDKKAADRTIFSLPYTSLPQCSMAFALYAADVDIMKKEKGQANNDDLK